MVTSEKIGQVMTAIKAVQQGAMPIKKETQGQVGTRQYKYANLNDTWETIKDLLNQNKLVIIQSPTTGDTSVGQYFQTTIYHTESNEWIREQMMMVLQRDDPQAIGAAITYYRRYMVTSMLGLIPDDDNDARDHRLATAQQKARLVGTVKQFFDVDKPQDIIQTIDNIIGKHPSRIREDEAEAAIATLKAFGEKNNEQS